MSETISPLLRRQVKRLNISWTLYKEEGMQKRGKGKVQVVTLLALVNTLKRPVDWDGGGLSQKMISDY